MAFDGFSDDTLAFLAGLSRHNDKVWFDRHKADYDEQWLKAGQRFIEALAPKLKKVAPAVRCEPKVNGSIFRIQRDVRFSQDKRPYKDHLDLWFWEGETRKAAVSGFFFRLKADYFAVGVGAHMLDPSALQRYRALVTDKKASAALTAAVRKVEKAGFPVQGEHYKRLPKGIDEGDVPGGELGLRLLKHNALWAGEERTFSAATRKLVQSAELVDHCVGQWKKMAPLHRWLVDHLQ